MLKKLILIFSFSLLLVGCTSKRTDEETKATSEVAVSATKESTMTSTSNEEESSVVYEPGSLVRAVTQNNEIEVKQILEDKNYDLNEVNEKQESPLLIATHTNQINIAKLLIDQGADVNQQDSISDSPYLYAGAQGKTEILAYMLEHSQPNQEIYNRFGGNTLIPAAEKGHLDNVQLLLKDGSVEINHQNNFGYTALIEAVALTDGSKVYQEIVTELLNNGADKSLKDDTGRTAEDYAEELGYQNILNLLQK